MHDALAHSLSDSDLSGLPEQINRAVRGAEDHARSAMDLALQAGQLLTRAKSLLPHGEWETWLVANCTVAPRTARAYMRLHDKMQALPPTERQRVADLPIREAVKAIGTNPETPPSRPSTVRIACRSNAERIAVALSKSATAIRTISRELKSTFTKRARIESARNKLQDALRLLDEIDGDQDAAARALGGRHA